MVGYLRGVSTTNLPIRLASGFTAGSVFATGLPAGLSVTAPLPREVEVLVIGAGLAGLGAATELAVRQHDVFVVEAGEVGCGPFASGLGVMHDTLPTTITIPDERERATRIHAAASEAHRWTSRVISEFKIGCGFDAATKSVDPYAYVIGLAKVAAAQGAAIRQNTRVVDVKPAVGGGFNVRTSAGRLFAKQVVITDAGLLKRLVPKSSARTKTEPWTYVVTEPVADKVKLLPDVGLRRLGDGRVLAAAQVGGPLVDARDEVAARLIGSQPALQSASADGEEVRISAAWQSTFVFTADGIPQAGEHDGIYFIVPGSEQDTSRLAWLGSRTARWMTGEAEPKFSVAAPQPKLAALVSAVAQKVKR